MKASYSKYVLAATLAATTVAYVAQVPATAAVPFTDLKNVGDHYTAIEELYNSGIITGRTATTFAPYEAATRAELALFIANALHLDTKNVKDPGFTDVPKNSTYYGAIAALYNAGIIGGYKDKTFKPNDYVKRSQVAKMLVLAFDLELANTTTTKFTDVNSIQDMDTRRYIQTLVQYNITKGTSTTTFSPNDSVKRAQLATFLKRAIDYTQSDFDIINVE
ncbi:S-layer homology domain-containing protein [Lysinibacillus sp. LZ02]|uniref:S-layer homology domain-containing protein n=1 Tax=Lysinibacillus sp. LZ02 TaxID=3420668 RepID=UPI003D369D6C